VTYIMLSMLYWQVALDSAICCCSCGAGIVWPGWGVEATILLGVAHGPVQGAALGVDGCGAGLWSSLK
jgi:hypothetical protein